MSSSENLADLRKSTSKEKDQEQIDAKKYVNQQNH